MKEDCEKSPSIAAVILIGLRLWFALSVSDSGSHVHLVLNGPPSGSGVSQATFQRVA
jgi:hypothetical protein